MTHTQWKDPDALDRCTRSVQRALREGMHHHILEGSGEYVAFRMRALGLASYVAFVDDDDEVEPDALEWCANALKDSGAAVSFTQEVCVDATTGLEVSRPAPVPTYAGIAISPRTAHHLVMIRSDAVDPYARLASLKCAGGFADWFIVASAALKHGAIHVPRCGYRWYVNQPMSDSSRMKEVHAAYKERALRLIRLQWGVRADPIPIWVPN